MYENLLTGHYELKNLRIFGIWVVWTKVPIYKTSTKLDDIFQYNATETSTRKLYSMNLMKKITILDFQSMEYCITQTKKKILLLVSF